MTKKGIASRVRRQNKNCSSFVSVSLLDFLMSDSLMM